MLPRVGDWVSRGNDIGRIQGMLIVNGEVRKYIVCTLFDSIQRWEPEGLRIARNPFTHPDYEPHPAA